MSSHRPKSLSELNNVYDRALRAEKAIKESSSMLSIPETRQENPSENIFQQLETKAAEAKKNQAFDPDITNIASDFLKRYAQPEKPKAVPKEIKRPAPTIQSVQPHVRKAKSEIKADDTLPSPEVKAPVHRPSHDVPSTDAFVTAPQTIVSAEPSVPAYAEPVAAEPSIEEPVVAAPVVETPVIRQTPVKAASKAKIDHTPRPAPRVRITSTERSELMEEYMRVMSDEDDEPSEKKSVFSFFRKKKREDYDEEPIESIYEDLDEEDDSAEDEVPVVAFDSSNVKYEDEYSEVPVSEDEPMASSPMNLYDYIEADFDYEEDENGTLDISTTTFEKEDISADELYSENEEAEAVIDEADDTQVYPAEEENAELTQEEEIIEEATEDAAEEIPAVEVIEETDEVTEEEITEVVEVIEEEPVQEQDAEEIVPTEEAYEEALSEEVYDEEPAAEMVFEDIFSVSDESKRSHTGGDWGGTVPQEAISAYENYEQYSDDDSVYDGYDEYDEDEYDYDDEEYSEKKKGGIFAKIMLILLAVVSLTIGATTAAADIILDIDSGELISDSYRLFCADEDIDIFGISKGDLIITKSNHVDKDDVYVFATDESTYGVGKVIENTNNPLGELLLSTETKDGPMLISRDDNMGVVVGTYSILGTILSIVCNYGIFIAVALVLVAIALIVLVVINSKKKSSSGKGDYTRTIFDEDFEDDDNSSDYDEEYYSEYDTDGIEQGLFTDI